MLRRRLTVPIFVVLVMLVVTVSCGQDRAHQSVATDTTASAAPGGFGAAGMDGPVPVPLAAPQQDEAAARRRAAARRAAARRAAASPELMSGRAIPMSGTTAAVAPANAEQSTIAFPTQAQQPGSMLIRSGHAVVEVDSVQVGIARVRRLAQESGAFVANTSVQTGREQRRSASLELRIPSERFDAVVNGLGPIGKVESVNISAQDVGEEFVDLSARVANARRLEARLIELLANRTGRLTDVLSVERELARVREEIERYEGRLRYLQTRVSVSSLTVVVHEPLPVVAKHPGENVIADAFVEAWRRFVLLTAGFIASLGVVIPVAAIGLGAFVLGRRYLGQKTRAVQQA
ncbi:MAG: DUF4349 domain-containing protein [Gemmatimonadaceae bacterium]